MKKNTMRQEALVSLVLPCKNENRALQVLLSSIPSCVHEVLIIDNGSTDKTRRVAKKFGARVLTESRTDNGIGYGFAMIKGIREAMGDILVCMDGDGSYPINAIPYVVEKLNKHRLDFISCNRLPFQNGRTMSLVRMSGVLLFNAFIKVLFGYRINDALTGMWVFKKDILAYLTCKEGGWNFSLEIKLRALAHPKIRFAEYHIPYRDREFDSSKQSLLRTGVQHLVYLLRVKFEKQTQSLTFFPGFRGILRWFRFLKAAQ